MNLQTEIFTQHDLQQLHQVVPVILKQQHEYGRSKIGRAKRVLVEFVSANPNGPLNVGHGRHAAYGAVVSNLLDAVGFITSREYYVNDTGRQMDKLAVSVWLRYLEMCGQMVAYPSNAIPGDYVMEIARKLHEAQGETLVVPFMQPMPAEEAALIERVRQLLGAEKYQIVFDTALEFVLEDISDDLAEFGIYFDHWFSERTFADTNAIDKALETLRHSGQTYEKEGALWFRGTDYSDEKDRILITENGEHTFFCNDAAYHLNKFERGFDIAIDIFDSGSRGYLQRMKGIVAASGVDPERLIHLQGESVTLRQHDEPVTVSTQNGAEITLRELREKLGNNVTRYFYVMQKYGDHFDFNLDLAMKQTLANPVYFILQAYAGIPGASDEEIKNGIDHLSSLTAPAEHDLLKRLVAYPEVIANAAISYEPNLLTDYLHDLAAVFHAYAKSQPLSVNDKAMKDARMVLLLAIKQVMLNAFNLLGITAPETI